MNNFQRANIWLHTKPLGGSQSVSTSSNPNSLGGSRSVSISSDPSFQHWAVVAEYIVDEEVDAVERYEAYAVDGYLVATNTMYGRRDTNKWLEEPKSPQKTFLGIYESMNQGHAQAFCTEVTQRKKKYSAKEENCQKFVNEFMAGVMVGSNLAGNLPWKAEEVITLWGSVCSTSLNSVGMLNSAGILKDKILKKIVIKGTGDVVFKQTVEKASIQGIGQVSLLTESPLKEWVKETGKSLVLSASGEITENLLNACRGTFTWWNLLQIPVELITKSFMESKEFSKIEAYGGSKLASVLTAAGVGSVAGGPFGLRASVGFWIATEIAAYIFRDLMERAFGQGFTDIFGESKTAELAKMIYNWFKAKIYIGMEHGITFMKEYINTSQGQKKIA